MGKIILNTTALLGENLTPVKGVNLQIREGKIVYAGKGSLRARPGDEVYDGSSLLVTPGLINAHTHIGDSVAKDAGVGKSIDELVHPAHGLKRKILSATPEKALGEAMLSAIRDMLRSGITTFADFREGGIRGVRVLRQALTESGIRCLVFGRPLKTFPLEALRAKERGFWEREIKELEELLSTCEGLGLSGPNEFTDRALRQVAHAAKAAGKPIAIHAAEAESTVDFSFRVFGRSEVARAIENLSPSFLIHLTAASREDLRLIAARGVAVVCCPRANGILGAGFPPIDRLYRLVPVALGTDNVMLNSPDLFREMDYASKTLRALKRDPAAISPLEILKMVTVKAAEVLGIRSQTGTVEAGKAADLTFLDLDAENLRDTKNFHAALVHRARPDNVRATMVRGNIVYGSLEKRATA